MNHGLATHFRKLFPRDIYMGIELEVYQRFLELRKRESRLLFDALESGLRSAF